MKKQRSRDRAPADQSGSELLNFKAMTTLPPPRPSLIYRKRLFSLLDKGLLAGRRVTLVSAPAGYGKSVLASEWIRSLQGFYSTPMDRVLDTFVFSPIIITIWAVMFVEMTRLTGSVWPAVLMHVVEDAVPNYLVFEEKLIQFNGVGDLLFNPVRGVLPLIAFLAFGLWLRRQRLKQDGELIRRG